MFKSIKKFFGSDQDIEKSSNDKESGIVSLKFYDELSAIHIPKLKGYGVSDLDILDTYEQLNGRERDIIWSLYNMLLNNITHEKIYLLKEIYNDMISMLEEEEKNCNHLVKVVNRLTLKEIRDAGTKKVSVISDRDGLCKSGEEVDGQEYSIDAALKNCPIPADGCKKKHCTCSFLPIA